jgi:hypothetical protein
VERPLGARGHRFVRENDIELVQHHACEKTSSTPGSSFSTTYVSASKGRIRFS